MSSFVGENPVILSGALVAAGDDEVVIGDGLGHTLTFRWTEGEKVHAHGSPSAVTVELPRRPAARTALSFSIHIEGSAVQLHVVVDPVDESVSAITYTMLEDHRALLLEAQSPAHSHHDATEGSRTSIGPD